MDTQFESPTNAPVKADRPWMKRVTYKSGKTPQGFAAAATPEQVGAGFSYWDNEAKEKFAMNEFAALVVATLSGVSGTVPDGNNRYVNYYSSLVFDTRTDPIKVFMQGAERPICAGIYRELDLPNGVNYTQYLICYVPHLDELISLELTAGLQNAVKRAIAVSCGERPGKISLFNLCDLSTEFWGIRFSGEFDKRDKEGNEWAGKGEMYFMPKLSAGVVTIAKNAEIVERLNGYADEVRAYSNGYADNLRSEIGKHSGPSTPPTATNRQPDNARPAAVPDNANFPTEEVGGTDDLPF